MSVTIRDVARAAGVSTATVSKAMNGSGAISQATCERIFKVISELGYRPNSRAQSFASKSCKSVTFLTVLGHNIAFQNPHMFEIMAGAEVALSERGYSLRLKGISPENACAYISEATLGKETDAVIVHASALTKELADALQSCELPHIVIGQPPFLSQLCWIDTNNHLSGEMAVRHLACCGYTKISFVGGKPEDMTSWHRLRGARSAMNSLELAIIPEFIRQSDSTYKDGLRMTSQLLRLPELPQAIICANNYIAIGCIQAIRDKKLSIPRDIAVMTFDDYPFASVMEPRLTVVNIDMFDMGYQAGGLVIRKINNPSYQVQSFATLPILIDRETTPPIK